MRTLPSLRRSLLCLAVAMRCLLALAQTAPAIASANDNAVLATGSSIPRTPQARAADLVNLRDFGAAGNGQSDDSPALAAAIAALNARMALGLMSCLYAPPGDYLMGSAATIPAFANGKPGCVTGDGPNQTRFILSSAFTGDLFAWSEAWIGAGNTPGARASGFAVYGAPLAIGQQNALMFYDREDQVLLSDVDIWNLPGRAFYSGMLKNSSQSYMRESRIRGLRIFNSGTATLPALEFSSEGGNGTDGTNEISISQLDIYGSPGRAMVIHNNSQGALRNFKVDALRLEGLNLNTTNTGDLLTIGDPAMTGSVTNLQFTNFEAMWVPANAYAIRFTAPNAAVQPYNIWITGLIGNGPGGGIRVDAGRQLKLAFPDIATAGTNVVIGPSTLVGANITVDGNGAERLWTYAIDSSSLANVQRPFRATGNPAERSVVAQIDGLPPVAPGSNAVDMQLLRTSTTHIATGDASVVSGGEGNQAANTDSIVTGGAQNLASGYRSAVLCGAFNHSSGQYAVSCGLGSTADGDRSVALGERVSTRNSNGKFAYGGGVFATPGDAQMGWMLLRAAPSTLAPVRLTSDGQMPGSGNVVNIPVGTVYHLQVSATCRDTTTGDWAGWRISEGWLSRPAADRITYKGAYTIPTPPNQSDGVGAKAMLMLAADGINGGLAASVTMPNANQWHCVAKAETPEEVQ